MSLPILRFKATNVTIDPELQDLVTQKFSSLEKYLGDETDVNCDVEFEKETDSKSGNIFRVEANLWLHGTMYRADASLDSFEKAIDEVRAELDKKLRRAHNKRESLIKRGGRNIKNMMRFGK